LTLLVGSHDLYKYRPRMTYTVSSGTLNPTQLSLWNTIWFYVTI